MSRPQPVRETSLHRKTKGDVAEAHIIARLLELGKTVLRPVGDNARFDLVIYESGAFQRVQCKSAFADPRAEQVLKFPACSSATHINRGKRSYRGECDLFAVWSPLTKKVYLVPVSHCGTTEVSLRLAPAANGQVSGIRLASDYEV